jgi:hypothetical protein
MKTAFALAAFLLSGLIGTGVPAGAREDQSHVYVDNSTPDAWVWVTAYTRTFSKSAGAWCVAPGEQDRHGLKADVAEVRVEVTHKNCAHPVILDQRAGFPKDALTMQYHVRGSKGQYTFSK